MITASEPDARFPASAQSTPSCNTQSHVQDHPDKALAVLLTHISNSHATLVEYLDQHARTNHAPSAANIQAQTGLHLASAGLSTGIDDESAWANNAQEASEMMAGTSTPAAPMQLLPYQQELADCTMEEGNSVIFLPSGGRTSQLTVTLPYLHAIIISAPVECLQAALCIHVFTADQSHRHWTSNRGCKCDSEDAGCSASEACDLPHRPGTSAVPASCTIQLSTWPACRQVMSPTGFPTVHLALACL